MTAPWHESQKGLWSQSICNSAVPVLYHTLEHLGRTTETNPMYGLCLVRDEGLVMSEVRITWTSFQNAPASWIGLGSCLADYHSISPLVLLHRLHRVEFGVWRGDLNRLLMPHGFLDRRLKTHSCRSQTAIEEVKADDWRRVSNRLRGWICSIRHSGFERFVVWLGHE